MAARMNKRQLMFCKEYIVDLNGTQAAIRSGYAEKTARQIGSKLLTKVNIQEEIQRLMNKRSKKVEISADDVLSSIKDIRDLCVSKITVEDADGNEKIDVVALNGAIKTNDQLGKHLKLFTEKMEVESKGDLNINFNIPRPKKET